MPGEHYILDQEFTAEGAVTKYAVVVAGTAGNQVKLPAAAGATKVMGVAQHAADDGKPVRVRQIGVSYVVASGSTAFGSQLKIADIAGKVAAVAAGLQDIGTVGVLQAAAAADGDIVPALIIPGELHNSAT